MWAALNDPAILKKCIPGCERLEKVSPTEMTAAVVVKVGPVKANFTGKVILSISIRPTAIASRAKGREASRVSPRAARR